MVREAGGLNPLSLPPLMAIQVSPMVIVLVGGPCGPSLFNPANAECLAIGECNKKVYSHLVYCKISDDITVDSESQLLLTRAGRGFTVRHCKS